MNNKALNKMMQLFPGAPDWLLNDESIRQEFTQLQINQNRWNDHADAELDALLEFGYSGFAEYWRDVLAEPMKASDFINLMSTHLHDSVRRKEPGPKPIRAYEKAFDLAQDMREIWFFDGNKNKSLMVLPRSAAEWLLSMPKRRHLVPLTLAAFLRDDPIAISGIANVPIVTRHPAGRKQGRPSSVMLRVVLQMKTLIEKEVISASDLKALTEKELEAKFGASRDTCRKARDKVLSEIVENTILDNSATNDK